MPTGLRERKKQKTREAIQRAALRLFQKQGYEETTVEEIAAVAEISPSTFFNYFPTKEDVVLYDMYDPIAIDMIVSAPLQEPLNAMTRRILEALSQLMDTDKEMILSRAQLVMGVPELRNRMLDELDRTHALFTNALAQRTGRSAVDFELRVTTRILVGAIYEAVIEWMRTNGRENLASLAQRALDIMEHGASLATIAQSSRTGPARRRRLRPGLRVRRSA